MKGHEEMHRATVYMVSQRTPMPLGSKIQIVKAKVIPLRLPGEEVQAVAL